MRADTERLVICNPHARRSRGLNPVKTVRELFRTHGLRGEIITCPGWKEAVALAREAAEAGLPQVVAAGGDGTVNAVANGLAGATTALGVLPLGTGNILAYNLGVERLDQAVKALARGRPRAMDLGWINDRYFVALAGVGFDAEVVRDVDPNWQQQIGRFAFLIQGLIARSSRQPQLFRVAMEGDEGSTLVEPMWSALICNVPRFTWNLPLAPDSSPSDGLLDVILVRDAGAWEFIYGVSNVLFWEADLRELPGVSVHRVRSVRIDTQPSCLWEADGDLGGPTPVTIEVRPRALRVMAPA